VVNGRLLLKDEKSFMEVGPLPKDLAARTLEMWVRLPDLAQHCQMAMSILRDPDGCWDGVLYAERQYARWYPGSSNNHRSRELDGPDEDSRGDQLVHLAVVYAEDNSITLFRNGKTYGAPFVPQGPAAELQTYPKDKSRVLLGNEVRSLACAIEEASVYDRALTPQEVAALFRKRPAKPMPLAADLRDRCAAVLRIVAVIDGSDELHLFPTETRWAHVSWNHPTQVKLNAISWNPRDNPIMKVGLSQMLGREVKDMSKVTMRRIRGRGRVELRPGKDLVTLVFDDPDPGADVYDVILTFGQ
jgi:hypothetical protein